MCQFNTLLAIFPTTSTATRVDDTIGPIVILGKMCGSLRHQYAKTT